MHPPEKVPLECRNEGVSSLPLGLSTHARRVKGVGVSQQDGGLLACPGHGEGEVSPALSHSDSKSFLNG